MIHDQNIDELLNSFADGELSARQQAKVKHLIQNDEQLARQLREIERCRALLGSLPRADAPADLLDNVKAALERKILLGPRIRSVEHRRGARQLLARRVLSAAAMIALAAVLSAVVFNIIRPAAQPQPPTALETTLPATVETTPAGLMLEIAPAAARFAAGLELDTANRSGIESFIRRAAEDNGLSVLPVSGERPDANVYLLSGPAAAFTSLLSDLKYVWPKLQTASFCLHTERFGESVVVTNVSPDQVIDILTCRSTLARTKLAADFAAFNSMSEVVYAGPIPDTAPQQFNDLAVIPKPVLTSNEKEAKKATQQPKDTVMVDLTVVIAPEK